MPGIVGGIIDGCHRPLQIEVFHQHAFLVEVCHAQRTVYLLHAALLAPCLYSAYQGTGHLRVVDELNHRETHIADVPLLVSLAVDDSHDTSHRCVTAIGHKRLDVGKFQSGIFAMVKKSTNITLKVWNVLGTVSVDAIRHVNEIRHLTRAIDFYDSQRLCHTTVL